MCTLLTYIIIVNNIVFLTYSARNIQECTSSYQCQGNTISSNIVICSAFGGCDSAAINSKGAKGGVECTGSHGCNEAKSLKAVKNILCQGYSSCFGSGAISGKLVQCSGSQSCTSCDQITATTQILCGGLESCKSCPITAPDIQCDGSSSCIKNTISADNIYCSGNKACVGSKLTAEDTIECAGAVACKRSRIKAKKAIFNGFGAGSGAKIISVDEIEGDGYGSLEFAEMDSANTTTGKMTVKLSQTSGSDATILCQEGTECDVECTDNCDSTDVLAFAGSDVTVTVAGTTCNENSTDPNCPTIQTASSECENVKLYQYLQHKNRRMFTKYAIDEQDYMNEYEYGYKYAIQSDVSTQNCDKKSECANGKILEKEAQCYGDNSCLAATINQTTEAVTKCYGQESCFKSILNNKVGNIECQAAHACFDTKYMRGKGIYCTAHESCLQSQSKIISSTLDCEGTKSCASNKISNKLYIKCVANRACSDSILSAGNSIFCDGSYSCANGNLSSITGAIKCTGSYSCNNAIINAPQSYVYADGDRAALDSTIYSINVRGYGYKSLSNAIIDSNYLTKLNVKLYGNLTGYNAMIICRAGDVCTLKCDSTGCKSLKFYCLGAQADCKVSPTNCINTRERSGTNPKQINGIYCPETSYELPPNYLHDRNNMMYVRKRRNKSKIKTKKVNVKLRLMYGLSIFASVTILIYFIYCKWFKNKQNIFYYQSLN